MDPIMGESPPKILIVDLERFSTLIAKMLSGEFVTYTATDGVEAIQHLQETPPDLVLIEQSIPGDGLRLAELIGMNPAFDNLPIILMSVTPTPDGIVRARQAGVNTYLAKPFRPSELRERIDDIFARIVEDETAVEEIDPDAPEQASQNIKDRIKQIDGLPSFPATHAQILELANSDESSSEDIAEQLQMDPSLLATVFKIVNSSAYGFQKKVDSLKLAVTLLGLEEIANIVMTAQVFKSLGDYEGGSGFDRDAFWKHSVGTAFMTRGIARKLQTEVESAFLAGMLHDLGKVVLDRCFADYYAAVIKQVQNGKLFIAEAEYKCLGLTHADVGEQLAIEWKFAEKYLYSIALHHNPNRATRYQRLVGLVHMADIMCRRAGYGSGGDDLVPDYNETVLDHFALGDRGVIILEETANEQLEAADGFLAALSAS